MKNGKKREPFQDLLIPILCILCIMPFIVHLAEYDYGYGKYLWHSDNSVAQDLYTYYRSYFFSLIAILSVFVLAFRMGLYKEKNKESKIFLPLAVYGVFAVLSTICSVNPEASFTGNFYQFQSIFVLIGYCVMAFYAYQIMEKEQDYRTVTVGLNIMFGFISIVGWFQVFKHDLLNYEWMQKLVMNAGQFEEYAGEVVDVFSGNNVFLTLYNPNYAAVFLVMMVSVFSALFLGEKEKKQRFFYLFLLLSSLILLWFTYTRAALVAFVAGAVVVFLCLGKKGRGLLKYAIPGFLGLAVVLILMDAGNDFHFLSRMVDKKNMVGLEEVHTMDDGVAINYDGKNLKFSFEKGGLIAEDEKGNAITLEKTSNGEFLLPFSGNTRAVVMEEEEGRAVLMQIEDTTLEFVETEEGYVYRNEDGKLDKMTEIAHTDLHGMEYLGSGRGYIWSRVLPILKNYLFLGSGPDTFAEVFPQNDYVGKIVYANSARRVIEGAHNDFLTRWVQTGLISLVALLTFYLLFLKRCFSYYRNINLDTKKNQLGFGCFIGCVCYLICCFFSDSTLYTTPMFFVFAGIALSATEEKCL